MQPTSLTTPMPNQKNECVITARETAESAVSDAGSAEAKVGLLFSEKDYTFGQVTPRNFVHEYLKSQSEHTYRCYSKGLQDFADFYGYKSPWEAIGRLIASGQFEANMAAAAYRKYLVDTGFAGSTINLRIAALRTLIRFARILGLMTWTLDIRQVKVEPYRETKGPGPEAVQEMMACIEAAGEKCKALSARNKTIVRLLYDCALRRQEVVALDIEDVNFTERKLHIKGKGRPDMEWVPLSKPTLDSLREWITLRGHWIGPLFVVFTKKWKKPYVMTTKRLSASGLYKMVKDVGEEINKDVRPHGLRHSAITEALNVTDGDVVGVAAFSRHKNLNTVRVYDDNRQEMARTVSDLVAMQGKG